MFREIRSHYEILDLLRLRHRIYFEERQYAEPKPHGLDLTPHDHLSRFYGVFRGRELVGGVRFAFRVEQETASMMRGIRQEFQWPEEEASMGQLPSEEAFDVRIIGARASEIDVEPGRFVLTSGLSGWVGPQVLVSVLAVLLLEGARLYLYSCGTKIGQRYARYMTPAWTLRPQGKGLGGFAFPTPTIAAIGSPNDSPYIQLARAAADELRVFGSILLPPRLPEGL